MLDSGMVPVPFLKHNKTLVVTLFGWKLTHRFTFIRKRACLLRCVCCRSHSRILIFAVIVMNQGAF